MKVAIVHDWLTGMRGGEIVLEGFLHLFPDADLFTLLHIKNSCSEIIENRTIYTSFIQKLPFKKKYYRHYLPLFPTAIEQFNFWKYDLVISSSHSVAKGVIVPPDVPHISYIHSPMRYVWDMYPYYFKRDNFAEKFIIPFFANYLRIWDSSSSHRVDQYISNSKFVAERIKKYYGREAIVVHPPCIKQVNQIKETRRESFYLIVSALVPYKKVDLAIEAFKKTDKKLIIIGNGPEFKKLKSIAQNRQNIELVPYASRSVIEEYYKNAKALIFPGIEDFGIVPVEAQSFGCPVIAYRKGGVLETVVENKTGVFFDFQTPVSLLKAIDKLENMNFKIIDFEKNIRKYTYDIFYSKIKKILSTYIKI